MVVIGKYLSALGCVAVGGNQVQKSVGRFVLFLKHDEATVFDSSVKLDVWAPKTVFSLPFPAAHLRDLYSLSISLFDPSVQITY